VVTRVFVWLLGCSVWLSGYYEFVVYTIFGWLSSWYVVTRVFVWLLGCSVWLSGYYEFVVYTILGGCQAGMWLLVCLCGY